LRLFVTGIFPAPKFKFSKERHVLIIGPLFEVFARADIRLIYAECHLAIVAIRKRHSRLICITLLLDFVKGVS
jgi:hypothetical protein